jgi:hypothetical protein
VKVPIVAGVFNTLHAVASHLNQMGTAIQAGWNVAHNPDGTHKIGPRAKAYLGTGQVVATATNTRIVLDKETYDYFDEFDPTTGLWTAREDMHIVVHASLYCGNTATGTFIVSLNRDRTSTGGTGVNVISYAVDNTYATVITARHLTAVTEVERGDSIALMVEQVTGGNQTAAAGQNSTWMAITRTR